MIRFDYEGVEVMADDYVIKNICNFRHILGKFHSDFQNFP